MKHISTFLYLVFVLSLFTISQGQAQENWKFNKSANKQNFDWHTELGKNQLQEGASESKLVGLTTTLTPKWQKVEDRSKIIRVTKGKHFRITGRTDPFKSEGMQRN